MNGGDCGPVERPGRSCGLRRCPGRCYPRRELRMTTTGIDSKADESASGKFALAGRGASPVKDIGRLLLRCADRPGLVEAVTTFLARTGANIISLDQHSTEQT